MQKPAFVTGIAYIQVLTFWTMVKTFDTPLVNRAPLYLGSWLAPHLQWDYYAVEALIVALAAIGLFLGHSWPRWILLAGMLVGWIVSMPLHDARGLLLYGLSVSAGAIVLSLLFVAPSVRAYFSRREAEGSPVSIQARARGFVATILYTLCALGVHGSLLYSFIHPGQFAITLAELAAICLPSLLLGMAVRWNLASAYRDGAIVLLSTSLFSLLTLVASIVFIRFTKPESLALVDMKQPVVAAAIVVLGWILARASKRQASVVVEKAGAL